MIIGGGSAIGDDPQLAPVIGARGRQLDRDVGRDRELGRLEGEVRDGRR